jgi:DNA-binding MarR family transcriptional regulator
MAFTIGEDDACASFYDNSDASRRTDVPLTETRLLPGRIANAIVAIYEDLDDCKLNPNHRKVLACLVRCGLKQHAPRDYIFIKKSTISKKTGLHEATIYRSLNALEAAGLIEREPQHKTLLRLQVIGRIRLTPKALVALNIDISRKPAGGEGGGTPNRLAAVRDVNGVNTQSSSKKQPAAPGSFVQVQGRAPMAGQIPPPVAASKSPTLMRWS